MKKYRVFLKGENFLIKNDKNTEKFGFYTTRYLEADDVAEAGKKSVELIQNDSELRQVVLNNRNDPPRIYMEIINELTDFEGVNTPGSGYTFYLEDTAE